MRVLIVDDEPVSLDLSAQVLRELNYDVETARNGREAYELICRGDFRAVISDWNMPEMTGLELQALLSGRDYPLQIIFVIGHGGVPESVQAIKGGAVDFLEKPFSQTVLIERIETAFELARRMLATRAGDQRTRARFDRLTARELEIVQRMVEMPSETSSKEVGNYLGISPRTVDHHRARILEKLEIKSVAELIAVAQTMRST